MNENKVFAAQLKEGDKFYFLSDPKKVIWTVSQNKGLEIIYFRERKYWLGTLVTTGTCYRGAIIKTINP
jgi:hypothetical protein